MRQGKRQAMGGGDEIKRRGGLLLTLELNHVFQFSPLSRRTLVPMLPIYHDWILSWGLLCQTLHTPT